MVLQPVDGGEEPQEERRSGRKLVALQAVQLEEALNWQKRKRIIPEIEKLRQAAPAMLEHPITE